MTEWSEKVVHIDAVSDGVVSFTAVGPEGWGVSGHARRVHDVLVITDLTIDYTGPLESMPLGGMTSAVWRSVKLGAIWSALSVQLWDRGSDLLASGARIP